MEITKQQLETANEIAEQINRMKRKKLISTICFWSICFILVCAVMFIINNSIEKQKLLGNNTKPTYEFGDGDTGIYTIPKGEGNFNRTNEGCPWDNIGSIYNGTLIGYHTCINCSIEACYEYKFVNNNEWRMGK